MQDFRYALRSLAKSPGFTAVVVLSLALGIGANTTVLSWVRQVLLRPIPGVAAPSGFVALVSNQGGGNVSNLDLRDFAALDRVFFGGVATQISPASLLVDGTPQWIFGQLAPANFFDLLGVRPLHGRTFLPDEDQRPGGNPVLVIRETLWRRAFNADPSVIGRTVDLNRHAFTIVGVVPAEFSGTMTGVSCEFWAPVSMVSEVANWNRGFITSRQARGFHNALRLQPGVTLAQAQAAVDALDAHLAETFPQTNRGVHHRVVDYADCPYGAQAVLGAPLKLLLVVSLGVLLIVAANVANLLLARAATRQKEIAIRLAAGASRARIVRLLLIESVVLALLGGAAGALLASWMIEGLAWFVPPVQIPVALASGLHGDTLVAALVLTLVAGLGFGLVPAWQATRPRLYDTLKESGRSGMSGPAHHRVRSALVIAEIALALVLLVSAGLCLQGLRRARQADFGFNPDGVLIAGLQLGMNGYNEATGRVFYRQLQERVAGLPDIEEASFASWLPLGLAGCKGHGIDVEGYVRAPGENPTYEYAVISPRYFATLQIPLVAGRDFRLTDDGAAPRVAIVNEHLARKFWPGQDAVGRRLRVAGEWRTVVGVAKAGKYNKLDEAAWPFFYLPYTQYVPDLDLSLCVRTRQDPAAATGAVRRTVRELDPGVDLWGSMPMTAHVQGAFFGQRLASTILLLLGAVALLLAAMGVFAVMAYSVNQRVQEFGVRLALGAAPGRVLRLVLGQGLRLAALGIAVGLLLTVAVTRLLTAFLHGVHPLDPVVLGSVCGLLALIAVLACWLPAWRATRVDPIEALRAE
ncbi:MAG: ABC transporter permease [Opitutae bacterium]|nr:ABC transporter permease [Opitutae bacterium]